MLYKKVENLLLISPELALKEENNEGGEKDN